MKIIGMIPVYNESDIVGYVVDHLVSQGIELVILDNGSTDGSYEICMHRRGRGVVSIARLETKRFDFDLMIETLNQMALREKPKWILLSAADEFLESPYPGLTLSDSIKLEDSKGFNLIQFNNFEFWPTDKDCESAEPDVRKRIKYYTWNDDMQFRCWRAYPGTKVSGSTGHYPEFPKYVKARIPREKYVLRHYRIRSYRQGLRKIFSERLPRYDEEERSRGLNVHYDKFGTDPAYYIINSANLIEYRDDGKWRVRKTFDWTWGLQARPWAHPPTSRLSIRLANKFPTLTIVWKRLFLRKKRLPFEVEAKIRKEHQSNE